MRGVALSAAGIVLAAAIVGAYSAVYNARQDCVSKATEVVTNYKDYAWEIYARKLEIAARVALSKTISDLRVRMEKPNFSKSALKDKSLGDLEGDYASLLTKMKLVDNSEYRTKFEAAEKAFKALPEYQKYQNILLGQVWEGWTDDDLPHIKQLVAMFPTIYLDYELRPLRTIFEPSCTIEDSIMIAIGARPIRVRGELTTFLDVEKWLIKQGRIDPGSSIQPVPLE